MKSTIAALLSVATIGASLMTAAPANAGDGSVAAGVAAGLIGGAIVGGAIASSRPVYSGPAYYAEPTLPPVPPGCYWLQQRYWDGWGWVYRPARVCY